MAVDYNALWQQLTGQWGLPSTFNSGMFNQNPSVPIMGGGGDQGERVVGQTPEIGTYQGPGAQNSNDNSNYAFVRDPQTGKLKEIWVKSGKTEASVFKLNEDANGNISPQFDRIEYWQTNPDNSLLAKFLGSAAAIAGAGYAFPNGLDPSLVTDTSLASGGGAQVPLDYGTVMAPGEGAMLDTASSLGGGGAFKAGTGALQTGLANDVAPSIASSVASAAPKVSSLVTDVAGALGISENAAKWLVTLAPGVAGALLTSRGPQTSTVERAISPTLQAGQDAVAQAVIDQLPGGIKRDTARADQLNSWANLLAQTRTPTPINLPPPVGGGIWNVNRPRGIW